MKLSFRTIICSVVALALAFVAFVAYVTLIQPGEPLEVSEAYACMPNGECKDPIILLSGVIQARSAGATYSKLLAFTSAHPNLSTICLVSSGGNVDASTTLGHLLRVKGFNTCIANTYRTINNGLINGVCQSSCTWVTLSGKETILYDNSAILGFHAARKQRSSGDIIGPDFGALSEFKKMIDGTVSDTERREKIYNLLAWSFEQGATKSTTNCTTQQVQERYPYFTKILDTKSIKYRDCGLNFSRPMRSLP